jgi:Tol biopolymer transport system component
MDPGTLAPAVRLLAGGVELAGTVSEVMVDGDVLAAQFAPDGPLAPNTTYQLNVSTAARSVAGAPLGSSVLTDFTTGAAAADAMLEVTTTTTGNDIDPNGYDVVIDGAGSEPIGASGTVNIPVAAGTHTVTLSGATPNCVVADPTQEISVESGGTASVSFSVVCATVPTSGSVRIFTSTGGTDLDVDGYRITVGFAPSRVIGLNAEFMWVNLSSGVHTVDLSELSQNCTAAGGTSRSATVVAGTTVDVTFDITCRPVNTGTVVVTTSTSGPDQDADGYTVSINFGPPEPIAANGTMEMVLPDTTAYSVRLAGIAGNCSLSGTEYQTVQPMAGTSTVIAYEVACLEDFRPSGTLAFTAQDATTWSIFTGQADGSGRVRIATGTGVIGPLDWSPDGQRLAFAIWTPAGQDMFVVNADGSNLQRLLEGTEGGEHNSPTWSPDGTQLVYAVLHQNVSHWQMRVATLSPGGWSSVQVGPLFLNSPLPSWSPDGTRIAFIDDSRRRVYTMLPDGSGTTPLPVLEGSYQILGQPAWSPDGTMLAVPGWEQDEWTPVDILSVLLMRSDGSEGRVLTSAYVGMGSVSWSPDGSMIAYPRYCESAQPCIGYVNLEGRVSTAAILNANNPAWRP